MTKYPLYEKVCDYQKTIKKAYYQTQKGNRKYRKECIVFDMARERNLVTLWRSLKDESYKIGAYNRFLVHEPKERVVSAPRIRDKIVQFACHMVLNEVYDPVYIQDTFACLEDKGTHRAIDKIQHNMRMCQRASADGGWTLKMDIRKYFYSIDRDVLKKLLRKKIKDEKFLKLLDNIIDSSPEGERGLPLGNVTSQDFANIYLNEVDQYAKRYLGLKWYARYNDDIDINTETKEKAQEVLKKLLDVINNRLHIETNEKTKIFPIKQGVNTLGFKVYTTHRLICNDSKAKRKRTNKAMARKVKDGIITQKDFIQSANSWLGHARHSNSYNLAKKIFADYDYIKIEHPKYKFGRKPKDT